MVDHPGLVSVKRSPLPCEAANRTPYFGTMRGEKLVIGVETRACVAVTFYLQNQMAR